MSLSKTIVFYDLSDKKCEICGCNDMDINMPGSGVTDYDSSDSEDVVGNDIVTDDGMVTTTGNINNYKEDYDDVVKNNKYGVFTCAHSSCTSVCTPTRYKRLLFLQCCDSVICDICMIENYNKSIHQECPRCCAVYSITTKYKVDIYRLSSFIKIMLSRYKIPGAFISLMYAVTCYLLSYGFVMNLGSHPQGSKVWEFHYISLIPLTLILFFLILIFLSVMDYLMCLCRYLIFVIILKKSQIIFMFSEKEPQIVFREDI